MVTLDSDPAGIPSDNMNIENIQNIKEEFGIAISNIASPTPKVRLNYALSVLDIGGKTQAKQRIIFIIS